MAGDWIKVEHVTPDKPEVVAIAAATGLDQDAVVGKLLRLWIWADQQSVDGDAMSVTNAFLDRLVFHSGFARALSNVGWLDGREGRLSIPNFDRHNGQTAKKRAQTSKRMQTKRKRDAGSVTNASPEKRREEKSIREREREEGWVPKQLDSQEFRKAWQNYLDWWFANRGSPMDPIQRTHQLQDLMNRGPEKAIADLKLTMTNSSNPGRIWDSSRENRQGKQAKGRQRPSLVGILKENQDD